MMPEAIGQHHDVILTGLFFVSEKRTTECGAHTEHVEERWGDVDATNLFRVSTTFMWVGDGEPPVSPRHHVVEETGFAAPIDEVCRGGWRLIAHRQMLLLVGVVDPVQLLGVVKRRRPQ